MRSTLRKLLDGGPWPLALVWLITIAATAAKFDNELVYDDGPVIGSGSVIHDPSNIPNVFMHRTMYAQGDVRVRALDTYRPVTLVSFFWDAAITGRRPLSYHVTNEVLHLLCVTLVYWLARALLSQRARPYAVLAALFFALSPQLGEAHVWINGRSDLFCTAFGLAALLTWRRALESTRALERRSLLLAAFSLLLLGLLSKEVLIMLVPLLLFWPSPDVAPLPLARRLRQALPLLLAPLPYLAARALALRGLRASDPEELSRVARHLPLLLLDGLRELVLPGRLYLRCMHEEYRGVSVTASLAAALALLMLAVLALRFRRRAPLLLWCLAWFVATLAPAALISTPTWAGFGRYLYLPCVGLAVGLTELGVAGFFALRGRLPEGRAARLLALGLSAYFVVLAVQLATVTHYYQNNQTLYGAAHEARPDAPYANEGLAAALLEAGKVDRAIPLFERAAAQAPESPRYVRKLFAAYMLAGQTDRARALMEAALPRFPVELSGDLKALLIMTTHTSDPERTIALLTDCLRHQPDLADCRRWLPLLTAPTHAHAQRYRAALAAYLKAPSE